MNAFRFSMVSGDSWMVYLVSGILALTLSSLTTGCRMGNRVETSGGPPPDVFSGFYKTEFQAMRVCVKTSTSNPACAAAPEDTTQYALLPTVFLSKFQETITNPVEYRQDISRGVAFFISKDFKSTEYLPTGIAQGDGNFRLDPTPSQEYPFPLLESDPCRMVNHFSAGGNLGRTGAINVENNRPILGHLTLNYLIDAGFQVSCAPLLSQMGKCLQDVNQCGFGGTDSSVFQSNQDAIQSYFQFFFDANLLTPSDIPNLQGFSFEAVYP